LSALTGFAQVRIHTGGQTLFLIAGHRPGGHRDHDGVPVGTLAAADLTRGFEAIHIRHLAVHEHGIDLTRPRAASAPMPLSATSTTCPIFSSIRTANALIDGVVVNDEQARFRCRCHLGEGVGHVLGDHTCRLVPGRSSSAARQS